MSNGQLRITGCKFLDICNKKWIHGDLYQIFDALVIVCEPAGWHDCVTTPLNPEDMMVRANHYFEKNNILVFPLTTAIFNEHAHEYLTDLLRGEEKQLTLLRAHTNE